MLLRDAVGVAVAGPVLGEVADLEIDRITIRSQADVADCDELRRIRRHVTKAAAEAAQVAGQQCGVIEVEEHHPVDGRDTRCQWRERRCGRERQSRRWHG